MLVNVLFVIVTILLAPIAPPLLVLTELPLNVLLVAVTPEFDVIAPPESVAELPLNVLFDTVTVLALTAPPLSTAFPARKVRPLNETFAALTLKSCTFEPPFVPSMIVVASPSPSNVRFTATVIGKARW